MKLLEHFRNRRLLVDALALFFGIGGWLGVEAICMQLPLLVNIAPEGWRFPVFLSIIAQLANIGPILYSIYAKFTNRTRDHLLIYGLYCGGVAAMFCLVFLHDKTSYIFGANHSTALLGFMFVTAILSCTSSVLFMPYMRNYREIYLVTYLVGEGLSSFVPSILALIQGVGGPPTCVNATDPNSETSLVAYYPDPRFSTSVFFALNGVILSLSFVAFVALNNLPVDSTERNHVKVPSGTEAVRDRVESECKMPRRTYIYLMVMMGVVCAIRYGTLPNIQSYSCLPYGNVAYHLAVTLISVAEPLVTCLGFFVKNHRVDVLSYLTAGAISLSAFLFYLALMSPAPPLQHTKIGEIMVVVVSIATYGLIGFVKLGVTSIVRSDSGMGLFFTGVAIRIGSLSGTVITFCLFSALYARFKPRYETKESDTEARAHSCNQISLKSKLMTA